MLENILERSKIRRGRTPEICRRGLRVFWLLTDLCMRLRKLLRLLRPEREDSQEAAFRTNHGTQGHAYIAFFSARCAALGRDLLGQRSPTPKAVLCFSKYFKKLRRIK